MELRDKFGRKISYLRLAITDRCNLRCQYCMPAQCINIVDRTDLLSYKEMYRLTRVLSELGVDKVLLTGGEPFVRKDFVNFLESLSFNDKLEEINITTNGALISNHIDKLEALNINAINLSIDSLQKDKFAKITRRDVFDRVYDTLEKLEKSKLKLKLNIVVQSGVNTDEIIDFIELSKEKDIAVRFIEEMPFNGTGEREVDFMDHKEILNHLEQYLPRLTPLPAATGNTSENYSIKGHQGTIGIIAAWSRTFCSDCNRIRITSTGELRNCLYDKGVLNLKRMLSDGASDTMIKEAVSKAYSQKHKDGHESEKRQIDSITESMSSIGG